jgi:hypothetical protein
MTHPTIDQAKSVFAYGDPIDRATLATLNDSEVVDIATGLADNLQTVAQECMRRSISIGTSEHYVRLPAILIPADQRRF